MPRCVEFWEKRFHGFVHVRWNGASPARRGRRHVERAVRVPLVSQLHLLRQRELLHTPAEHQHRAMRPAQVFRI